MAASHRSRSRRVATVNTALEGLWKSGLVPQPLLDPDELVRIAQRKAGSSDFGPHDWRANLEILCGALHAEAALNPLGRTIAQGQIAAALADRLRIHALWQRHPEIADIPLGAPVIILGPMRSGSTRVQRLLACDDRLTHTCFFESWNPVPIAFGPGALDDRRLRAHLALGVGRLLNPAFAAIHPTWIDAPDEETGLYSPSLFGAAFEAQWRVPSYAHHIEATDPAPVYRELRKLLQTIAWLRGDFAPRPWILKAPQMMQDVGTVREIFPGARFVILHRDAPAVIASSSSLTRNQMAMQSDDVNPAWIGREWTRKVALRQARLEAAAIPAERRADIAFDAMNDDWQGGLVRVYGLLKLPLNAALMARMAGTLAKARRQRLERHAYRASDFGLAEPVRSYG